MDHRFGLDQGFDLYDSPFDLSRQEGIDPSDLKRPAEEVTRSAEAWLDKNSTKPFFLFLHLYDLHTPYQLPAKESARFGGSGYDAELHYVDESLGQFLGFLRKNGLFDKVLIVFLSDHGESLGEHGEATHGYFIYQSTLHVPLVIHFPAGGGPFSARVSKPAALVDVGADRSRLSRHHHSLSLSGPKPVGTLSLAATRPEMQRFIARAYMPTNITDAAHYIA